MFRRVSSWLGILEQTSSGDPTSGERSRRLLKRLLASYTAQPPPSTPLPFFDVSAGQGCQGGFLVRDQKICAQRRSPRPDLPRRRPAMSRRHRRQAQASSMAYRCRRSRSRGIFYKKQQTTKGIYLTVYPAETAKAADDGTETGLPTFDFNFALPRCSMSVSSVGVAQLSQYGTLSRRWTSEVCVGPAGTVS